jgi:predicted acylesterase/phospholipase RssA/CRP-like cAMP-binding protein
MDAASPSSSPRQATERIAPAPEINPVAALGARLLEALPADVPRLTLADAEPLFREGDAGGVLYVVLDGRLRATTRARDGAEVVLGSVAAGEIVGEVQFLTGGVRTACVTADGPATIAALDADAFESLSAVVPGVREAVADLVRRRLRRNQLRAALRRLFGDVDDATLARVEVEAEWVHLRRNGVLFRQGDPGDSVYVVVSGRLRAILAQRDGDARVLGDVSAGESIGEMAFFTGETRSAAMHAVRDSVLVRFPNAVFETMATAHPHLLRNVARLVVERQRRSMRATPPRVTNVAVIAGRADVPLAEFAERLTEALASFGSTLHLDRATVDARLGTPGVAAAGDDDPHAPRLLAWLDEQEAQHRFVVYAGDVDDPEWTARCVRHADHVVLVADAASEPAPSDAEKRLLPERSALTGARRTLVLLQQPDAGLPSGTAAWLAPRRIDGHLHFRGLGDEEFGRLARLLSGRAVGLVLGGGGARGFGHIGVVRALREAGVPIDMVGGTSMGGAMAAQCAMGWEYDEMVRRNLAGWVDLRAHKEYTLPILSILAGRKAARMAEMLYGDVSIEDLWVPFFCVSTNLTRAEQKVHRSGPLRRATTASASLPGVVTPVVDDGNLLVDGAILNNVPADVMRAEGAGVVIVVDVSAEEPISVSCDAFPTPWQVLGGKFFRREVPRVPHIMEVLLRTTLLASTARANLTRGDADYYLAPTFEGVGLMEFEALEKAAEAGYRYAVEAVAGWERPWAWAADAE